MGVGTRAGAVAGPPYRAGRWHRGAICRPLRQYGPRACVPARVGRGVRTQLREVGRRLARDAARQAAHEAAGGRRRRAAGGRGTRRNGRCGGCRRLGSGRRGRGGGTAAAGGRGRWGRHPRPVAPPLGEVYDVIGVAFTCLSACVWRPAHACGPCGHAGSAAGPGGGRGVAGGGRSPCTGRASVGASCCGLDWRKRARLLWGGPRIRGSLNAYHRHGQSLYREQHHRHLH